MNVRYLLVVLLLLAAPARAEITFLRPPTAFCARVAANVGKWGLPNVEIAIETPRMVLGFKLQRGERTNELVAFDKNTLEPLGEVGLSDFGGSDLALLLFPKSSRDQDGVMHLPVYFDQHQGAGLGTEAKYAVMRYAFEVAGATGIEASVRKENDPSIGLHEKLGFKVLQRDLRNIHYGITKKEFEKVKARFGKEEEKDFLPRRR